MTIFLKRATPAQYMPACCGIASVGRRLQLHAVPVRRIAVADMPWISAHNGLRIDFYHLLICPYLPREAEQESCLLPSRSRDKIRASDWEEPVTVQAGGSMFMAARSWIGYQRKLPATALVQSV